MLVSALTVVSLVLGALFFGQRSLLYFPGSIAPDELARAVSAEFGDRAYLLPEFDAIVVAPGGAEPSETAILFHGNAGLNLHRAPLAREFAARGLRVVLAEYPGYGARAGSPGEPAIIADAIALYREVARRYPEDRLVLIGESLGSGVAAQVGIAADLPRAADRLVLITPLLSVADTAARVFPFLPVRLLVRDRFDAGAALTKFDGPVTILVAGQDEVLGPEPARRLAAIASARGPTRVIELERAGHNDWWSFATSETWDALAARP